MTIPLLEVTPRSQNQRVPGFEVANEDAPLVYRITAIDDDAAIDEVIWAAYRQIFSEHLILESYRQPALESQLRNRVITVREFVRELGKSEVYRTQVAETNSNYRLVDITFKRFLGRASYNQDERIAWSIVIATKGLHGFIEEIVESEEYRQNFGNDIVPFQRRRMEGRPFNLVTPRYGDDWRDRLSKRGLAIHSYAQSRDYKAGELDRQTIRRAIPVTFMQMAQGMLAPEVNYQRSQARVAAQVAQLDLADTTQSHATAPSVKPPKVDLPYRYIPTNPQTRA